MASVGDFVGVATALGGMSTPCRVEVTNTGKAVAFHRTELFERLADHIDLLQVFHSGLLKVTSPTPEPSWL